MSPPLAHLMAFVLNFLSFEGKQTTLLCVAWYTCLSFLLSTFIVHCVGYVTFTQHTIGCAYDAMWKSLILIYELISFVLLTWWMSLISCVSYYFVLWIRCFKIFCTRSICFLWGKVRRKTGEGKGGEGRGNISREVLILRTICNTVPMIIFTIILPYKTLEHLHFKQYWAIIKLVYTFFPLPLPELSQ